MPNRGCGYPDQDIRCDECGKLLVIDEIDRGRCSRCGHPHHNPLEAHKVTKPLSFLDLRPDELRPMTKDESKLLITLTLSGQSAAEFKEPKTVGQLEEFFSAHESKVPFLLAVLVRRLKLSKGKFSPDVVLLAAGLSSTPGEAVMWAYTLHLLAQQQPVGLDQLIMGPFGNGFPTDKGMKRIWETQKHRDAPLGNLLDSADTWKVESHEKAD